MREIKFRVWSDLDNRYVKDARLFELVTRHFPSREILLQDCDLYKFEQYTGLKDKNGIEIYEGDKLRGDVTEYNHKGRICTVEYTVEYIGTSFMIVTECGYRFEIVKYVDTTLNYEVIGNIHEGER